MCVLLNGIWLWFFMIRVYENRQINSSSFSGTAETIPKCRCHWGHGTCEIEGPDFIGASAPLPPTPKDHEFLAGQQNTRKSSSTGKKKKITIQTSNLHLNQFPINVPTISISFASFSINFPSVFHHFPSMSINFQLKNLNFKFCAKHHPETRCPSAPAPGWASARTPRCPRTPRPARWLWVRRPPSPQGTGHWWRCARPSGEHHHRRSRCSVLGKNDGYVMGVYVSIDLFIYWFIDLSIYLSIYIYIHIYMCVYIYIYIYIYIHTYYRCRYGGFLKWGYLRIIYFDTWNFKRTEICVRLMF